jgi:hypothetical protein
MFTSSEIFMRLIERGKIKEARAMLEREKADLRYAPDSVVRTSGEPDRFTRSGQPVELGIDGKWRLKIVSTPTASDSSV